MKNTNIIKVLASLVLIAVVSTLMYSVTGLAPIYTASALLSVGFLIGLAKAKFNINTTMNQANLYDGFVITDTTYAGEAAANFVVKAITGNETVQGGHVYVKDGVKKKFTIPRFDATYDDLIQDRQATPISKGDMRIDGKTLTPQDYMIYTEFNPRDFEAHWYATMQNNTLVDRTLPVTVNSIIAQEILKRHDRFFNKFIWNANTLASSTSIYRYTDGFVRKAFAASGGSDNTLLPASPTTLTSLNIVTELQKGYDLIPAALKYSGLMKIFCSYATYDLFCQYQIAQTNKGVDITQMGVPTFRGIPVVKIADFPDNTYFIAKGMATPESNLWVGMNSMDDAQITMAKVQPNSELWFFKMLMKVDVQIGWNSETVYYGGTPTTTP